MAFLLYINGGKHMFNEKDLLVYGTVGVFGIGMLLLIDVYVRGVEEFVPYTFEMR